MLLLLSIILYFLLAIYLIALIFFYIGLFRLHKGKNTKKYTVSILIPARNEAEHIKLCLESLVKQDYPKELIEIIVINDMSTDNTLEIVEEYVKSYSNISIITITEKPDNVAPKIFPLMTGIAKSKGDIIAITDGDCEVMPTWISGLISHYNDDIGVVTGVVTYKFYDDVNILLQGTQYLDYLSHTACAAGSIGMGVMNNCNGCNMSYRRIAYEEAGGYGHQKDLTAAEDAILAQRIHNKTKWEIDFVYTPDTFVSTRPVRTLKEIFLQRIRWASQSVDYPPIVLFFLISTFLLFLLLSITIPISLFYITIFPAPIICFAFKSLMEFLILFKFTRMIGEERILFYFPLNEILHIPYILIAAIAGQLGTFNWKGKDLKRKMT